MIKNNLSSHNKPTTTTANSSLMLNQDLPCSSNVSEASSIAGDSTTRRAVRHEKFNFGRCKVCHDLATGIHYGIPSCEGCKVKKDD